MRILHVISGIDPRNGGPAVALAGLARSQRSAGLSVSIASTWVIEPSRQCIELLENDGIAQHLLGPCREPLSRHPLLSDWLKPLILAADIVHIHGAWESIQHRAAALCRKLGKPYLFSLHGMLDRWNMSNGWLKKRLYLALRMRPNLRHAAAIHFATDQEREWTIPLPQHQIVEPFGVDFAEFDHLPPAATFADQFPGVAGRPLLLYLGRVDRGKGWEYLIPAFAKAAADPALQAWLLVIAGPDYFGNTEKARSLAHHHGIAERVLFTGMLAPAQRLAALSAAEMLALPSCHENFGIVVAEALAAGKPALVSNQVALHHQVSQWGAGVVTSLDIPAIASALQLWMSDESRRQAAGAAGRTKAREHFDWSLIGRHWHEHYQRILQNRGLPPT